MITIAKRFTFDAAHHIPTMPEGHKCKRMHGHTYEVEIELAGAPDPATGLFVDYADIAAEWQPLHDVLDHQVLNDIPGLKIPTTEVLVVWIMAALVHTRRASKIADYVSAVTVRESSTTWARLEREDLRNAIALASLAE